MVAHRTWSVLIAWDDHDDEQGAFGDTVRARDGHHAERITRARMCWTHWRNYRRSGESRRASLAPYTNSFGSYFGRVIDCHQGAIWKAAELEKVLRDLLAQVDDVARRRGWPDNAPREAARALLDEIAGL